MDHSIYSQAIFDNGHTVMLILDPADDGRIVDANDKAVRYYGWPRETLLSMRILDINTLPPDAVRAEIARAKAEDRHFFNFRHRHADGSVTDVEVFTGPLVVDGKTLLYSIIHDVTEKKALERQIERFNHVIDRAAVEIYSFDATSLRFIDANRGACANTGYSLEELRAMTPLDLKPEMTAADFDRLIAPLRAGAQRSLTFTTLHRRKDGSTYPVEIQLELMNEPEPLFVAIGRDLTDVVRREQELQLALEVVEASPVVSLRWRAEPGWPVNYVSSNISRWGYTPEQLKAGQPNYLDLIHPDDLPRISAEVRENTAAGIDSYTQEYRLKNAAGEYFWVEDHTRIVRDAQGQARFYEGVVTDIDYKKRAEMHLMEALAAQRELNKKLEEAQSQLLQSEKMASIGQLAAGVAHELNNPIGFVNSNLGTLENYLRDVFEIVDAYAVAEVAAPPECAELKHVRELKRQKDFEFLRSDIFQLMAESKDGLARVAKIVKDLKDFSRAGEAVWQMADLHQGLESTLNIVWNELKYKCTVKKEYGELPAIWCVPSQLNQVFMNLLVNAAHAIPQKGEITIRTGRQGDEVFVAISDTGTGIAPEHMNRIFEPFFTTKPVGKGTGLGLSLSWSIVKKHHGRFDVQSELGKGSTFTVWLPIHPSDDAGAVPSAPTSDSIHAHD